MEKITKTLLTEYPQNSQSNSDGFSLRDIYRKSMLGKLTEEDREYYITHYMTDEEKEIGKPLFDMNAQERLEYNAICENNKVGRLTGYHCPICKNKGEIWGVANGSEFVKECECMNTRRVIKAMERSGLGELLSLYKFENYKCENDWQTSIFNKAQAFVKDTNNKWFVMLGESGSGKSLICTAIARELLKQRLNLVFMAWLDDSTELKQFITDGEKYGEKIREYKEADVLYIDDFFKSENNTKPSAADIKLANEILNYRYNKARMDKSKRWVTLISSERTVQQLLEYDKAIAGRLIEMSSPEYLTQVVGVEKNYRLRNI